jgi:hypothetical protein
LETHTAKYERTNVVKLKKNGKQVTDIDMLLARDAVCVVLQIKALAGSGMNAYDHWRNKQIIEKGIAQAKVATEMLSSKALLSDILGRSVARQINIFQPVVLSTLHYFNGWQQHGVPVISIAALENLMRGATVNFWGAKGKLSDDIRFTKGEDISGDELLQFLQMPVDWRISELNEFSLSEVDRDRRIPLGYRIFWLSNHPTRTPSGLSIWSSDIGLWARDACQRRNKRALENPTAFRLDLQLIFICAYFPIRM